MGLSGPRGLEGKSRCFFFFRLFCGKQERKYLSLLSPPLTSTTRVKLSGGVVVVVVVDDDDDDDDGETDRAFSGTKERERRRTWTFTSQDYYILYIISTHAWGGDMARSVPWRNEPKQNTCVILFRESADEDIILF